MTTPRTRLAALAAAALVTVGTAGCKDTAPPATGPTVTGSTSSPSTASPTTTSSTPAPSTSSLNVENQAYADAEAAYREFAKSFQTAATHFDAAKLDKKTATPALLDGLKSELDRLGGPLTKQGVTVRWSHEIKSVLGTRYEAGKLTQLQVCAVTNFRFIKDGKDTTTDDEGQPLPMNTTPRANQIQLVSTDAGKSWRVNRFVYSGDRGAQC